jgi:hypothetical protein
VLVVGTAALASAVATTTPTSAAGAPASRPAGEWWVSRGTLPSTADEDPAIDVAFLEGCDRTFAIGDELHLRYGANVSGWARVLRMPDEELFVQDYLIAGTTYEIVGPVTGPAGRWWILGELLESGATATCAYTTTEAATPTITPAPSPTFEPTPVEVTATLVPSATGTVAPVPSATGTPPPSPSAGPTDPQATSEAPPPTEAAPSLPPPATAVPSPERRFRAFLPIAQHTHAATQSPPGGAADPHTAAGVSVLCRECTASGSHAVVNSLLTARSDARWSAPSPGRRLSGIG